MPAKPNPPDPVIAAYMAELKQELLASQCEARQMELAQANAEIRAQIEFQRRIHTGAVFDDLQRLRKKQRDHIGRDTYCLRA